MSADAESTQQTRRSPGIVRRRPGGSPTPAHLRAYDTREAPPSPPTELDPATADPAAVPADFAESPVWETVPGARGVARLPGAGDRDRVLRRALGISDVVAAVVSVLFVLNSAVWGPGMSARFTAVLLVPFVIFAAKAIGLYDRDQHVVRKTTLDEVPSLLYLSVLYALTVWLTEEFLFQGWLTRPQVFTLALMTFVLATVGRAFVRRLVTKVTPAERCLIVGAPADTARIVDKLETSPGVSAVVVGSAPLRVDDPRAIPPGHNVSPLADRDLTQVIIANQVERVIIAPDSHDQEEILQAIRLIKALGIKVSVLPRLLEVVGSSSTFEDVDGITLLGVRQYGVFSQSSAALKRAMDILGAGAGLVMLAPLLVFMAVAIKLDSRGPVFFRQRRIGRQGELFLMLKFRSMVEDADEIKSQLRDRNEAEGGLFKITDDPRITRLGRFLRHTSLDELPQLLNVVGGSMSLVGPRPLVPDEDALIEGWQRRRLAVKPGMTGLWQIFGSSRIPMNEMVKIDYLYGANWSLWLDLKILLRTVPYVLRRRGI
ncbi:MAG TPA: sugar transferase [Solirubrobacteraceae bacterium]|nr:sugar transferase [Solirubrobacteraceae bacterium]